MTYSVRNWERFQQYKDRNPRWIKVYRDLLNDPDWFALDGNDAKFLMNLWLLASEHGMDGTLPSIRKIAFRLHTSEKEAVDKISKLFQWIESDGTEPYESVRNVTTETETETETEEREGGTRAREPLISPEAFLLADKYREVAHIDADEPAWMGLPYTVQVWLERGYPKAEIIAMGARLPRGKPMGYHNTAIVNEMSNPKPKPQPREEHAQTSRPTTWQQSRDAWRQARAEFEASIERDAAEDEGGDGSDGKVVSFPASS